ncbi:MAG: hypothetical protein EOP56_14570 [Sphingobacteriales bacterium]|nr:MAG: hypothetical protein EOP56_14570 [Sphingobacteriales bacterium]
MFAAIGSSARNVDKSNFGKVDSSVMRIGPMNNYMLKQIVDAVTAGKSKQADRARAIYAWVAFYIDYDCRAHHHPKQRNNSASHALINRKTTYEGYANLYKTMCELAQIKCEVITGFAKYTPENIGLVNEKNMHAWNAILIDDTWYPVDATWGAGQTDSKVKSFTKTYNGAWFLADKELFALSHYPINKKWQMLDTPFNKAAFSISPIIGPAAIANEVYPVVMRGKIRGRADTSKKVAFEVDNPLLVRSVSVSYKYREIAPVPFTIEDNYLYVDIPFEKAGKYPVNIYINESLAYIYNADVAEPIKRPKPKPVPIRTEPVKRSPVRGAG